MKAALGFLCLAVALSLTASVSAAPDAPGDPALERPRVAPSNPTAPAVPATPRSSLSCNVTMKDVLREHTGGITQPRFEILDNLAGWCEFWDRLYAGHFPAPPCDTAAVDFPREVAVVAALGNRSNSCFDVTISCIARRGASLRVEVTEIQPGPRCLCSAEIVAPVHVVKMNQPARQADFHIQTATLDCP